MLDTNVSAVQVTALVCDPSVNAFVLYLIYLIHLFSCKVCRDIFCETHFK